MKKLKKSLSVLLTLVMLFTTLCFFPLDFGKVEADAAISGIKIVVPETLYLTPSTDASTTIQYYINNNADGSVKTSQDTTAEIHITYPGATLTSISAKTSADITLPTSITGLEGTTFGTGSTKATGTFSLPAGLNAGGTALVEWTFVFDVNGKTQTHYAYSVAYAPWYQPVGAAARAKGANTGVMSSSILWVQGVHGYTDGERDSSKYYAKINAFLPMVGNLKEPNDNNPGDWIQTDDNGLFSTMTFREQGSSATKYHAYANVISPTATITVDTSRYTNFNQIPNLKVGFMITDHENANEGYWYVSDYGITKYGEKSYFNGNGHSGDRYDDYYNDKGSAVISGWSNDNDSDCGIKVNQEAWDKGISGTADFRIKAGVYGYKKNGAFKTTAWNNNFVNISVTGANKGTLRTNVLNGTSYAKENYTADTWNTYYSALKTAATNLCNPTSATVDTSALTNAEAGLHTPLALNANGGTLGSSTPASVAMPVGGGATSSFKNADAIGAFNATRTGYSFLGWSTDKNATTAPETVTVGLDDTVYAVWKANTYNVVFDNMFDFNAFNITGSLDINERTDKGFTVTSTAKDGNTGFSVAMPVEPGKTYVFKADVQLEAVSGGYDMYVHTLDANQAGETTAVPDTTNGAHREGDVYISLTGQTTNTTPYIRFTAGDNTAFIKIRFDANDVGNKLTVNNIRVYEEGAIADGVSYEAPYVATYDSTYVLPTPTRENYAFAGWYTTPIGDGIRYSTGDTVKITETLHLYSRWTDANYFIAFDANTGNGTMATVKANVGEDYTLPANTFTKTGYHFVGWSTDKSATAGTYADKAGVQLATTVSTVTLYAVWAKNDYTINYVGGEGATGNTAPQAVKYDETATIRANGFSKPGYIFNGWTDGTTTYAAGQDVKNLTTVNGATITLTAVWEPITFTVNFVINDVVVDTFTVTYDNGDVAKFDAVKDMFNVTGYTFGGWETKEDTAVTSDNFDNLVTVDGGEITIYAIKNENSYTIQYNGNTATSGDTAQQTVNYTDVVTLNNNGFIKTGYTFVGWAETADGDVKYANGATGLEALTAEPDGLVTLYAVWEANTYTVKFDNNDAAATGSTADVALTYDEEKALTMNGFSKTGWSFVGWATAPDGEAVYEDGAEVINLTADKNGVVTLYALWEINTFEVTFKYKNVDGIDVAVTLPAVEYGTAFSAIVPTYSAQYYLSTDAEYHYNFSGWENKADTITEAVVFTAKYDAEKHVLLEDTDNIVAPNCEKDGIYAVICDCGYSYQKVDPATGHNYKDVPGSNTATCTKDGRKVQRCNKTNCPNPEIETESKATGHVFGATTPATTPDCTNTGNDAYKSCSVCNKFFAEDADIFSEAAEETADAFVIPATDHNYEGTVTTAATCTDAGVMTYTCLNDANHTYTEPIAAEGHKFTAATERVAPGCTTTGMESYKTCSVCNKFFAADADIFTGTAYDDTDVFVIEQSGHNYFPVVTPPTCEEGGYTTYTCSVCGDSYVAEPVDALGHTEAVRQENVENATCTQKGSYDNVTYCTVCGEVLKTENVTGVTLPHTYTEKIFDEDHLKSAATCTKYAVYYYDCEYCEANAKDDAEADKYTFELETTYDATNHVGTTTTANEDIVAGTCMTEKTWNEVTRCDDCKAIITSDPKTGEKDPSNHVGGTRVEKEDVVPGTCSSEETWNDVTYCLGCTAEIGSVPAKGEKNPANHSTTETVLKDAKDANCHETGYTGDLHCADCDAVVTAGTVIAIDASNHTGTPTKLINYVAATCYSEGYTGDTVYTCCDAPYSKGTVIAKTAHTPAAEAVIENVVKATCTVDGSHEEVIYCTVDKCKAVISRTTVTDTAPGHTPKEAVIENDIPATCTVDGSYDEVVYCAVCNEVISRVGKIHTAPGHTPKAPVIENEVKVTCTTDGSYDTVVYCAVCGTEISRETTVIKSEGHKAGEVVYENVTPATETENGKRDEVTYCTVCGTELSRETVVLKPVRIITFIMHDETIEVEAHTGDTLTPPTVKSYESADGFIHQFKSWDKELKVVTGNETYTATYTEPCDYTEIDRLEETLNDILAGGLVDDATLNEYKDKIDDIKAKLEVINANRNTLDKENQADIDVVVDDLEELVDFIYPDVGSTLEIVGASTFYTGSILELKAVKMPANAVISDVQWTSSDDSIVFCSNGKLFAIGVGKVTITAKRGILTATKTINVVEGGDVRAINFISMDKAHIIVEDYFTVFNAAGLYWSDANEIRFRVHVYQNFPYETYIVYINGVEAEADADGYYTVPANAGNVRVSLAGAVYKDDSDGSGSSGKWSFWEWLLMIFRKIAALFGIEL